MGPEGCDVMVIIVNCDDSDECGDGVVVTLVSVVVAHLE